MTLVVVGLGGYIANSPIIGHPIHAYAATIAAAGVIGAVLRRRLPPGLPWVLLLWVTYGLSAIANAPIGDYATEKTTLLFTATLLAAAAPLWLLGTEARLRQFLAGLLTFSVAVTGLAYTHPAVTYRLSLEGSNYIGSGRIINLAFVMVLLAVVLRVGPRLLTVPALVVVCYFAVLTGSRGPSIAALLAGVLVLMLRKGAGRGRAQRILSLSALLGLGVWLISQSAGYAEGRLLGLSMADSSVATRWQFYVESIGIGATHPFGVGWGNLYWHLSPLLRHSNLQEAYPHNLLLETWAEGGWFALVATVLFIAVALHRLWMSSDRRVWAATLGVTVYFVANAMVSADINGNRIIFTMLALGLGVGPVVMRTGEAHRSFRARFGDPRPGRIGVGSHVAAADVGKRST